MAGHKGTLLLDEIGDLSLELQAKLLQFIQEKKFFRLGSNKEVQADVRILAATHRNLDEMVREGKFREDLLYRLRVVEIEVPALRERRDDLFWLVPFLLDRITEQNNKPSLRLTHSAFKILYQYFWPGNIRELENVLEGALVMASDEEIREGFINELSLPQKIKAQADLSNGNASWNLPDLASLERQAIQQALVLTGGNRRLAASMLGISERTLYRALGTGAETPSPTTDI
jgi:transcriptional regulator with PAS, ATPase and Fis domain